MRFTPSMTSRFESGATFSTRPRLPRSLPVMTSTLSFLRIGVARRDMSNPSPGSQHFRRERDDLHEPALAQPARHRTEDARANRLALIVDEHGRVAIEPDIAAVAATLFLDRPHDHGLDDLALLDRRLGSRFLHRGGDDVAQARVASDRAADGIDDRDLAGAGVVGDVKNRSHLDHDKFSKS